VSPNAQSLYIHLQTHEILILPLYLVRIARCAPYNSEMPKPLVSFRDLLAERLRHCQGQEGVLVREKVRAALAGHPSASINAAHAAHSFCLASARSCFRSSLET
jgi:hypothetical protein